MRFSVVRLRNRGLPLGRERIISVEPTAGDLRFEHAQDQELRRMVRMARLVRLDQTVDPDLLPPLLDAQLIGMATQGFTLSGFERLDGRGYSQSWWVRQP